jgi:hypothetical protein
METQRRFPQGLGNLAQNARFPHSHKPIIPSLSRKKKTKNEDPEATANQPEDLRILTIIILLS